jgi:hypothetical protein
VRILCGMRRPGSCLRPSGSLAILHFMLRRLFLAYTQQRPPDAQTARLAVVDLGEPPSTRPPGCIAAAGFFGESWELSPDIPAYGRAPEDE